MNDHTPINYNSVEEKYESLYFLIIQILVDDVELRFSETNDTIIFIYSILTEDSKDDLTFETLEAKLIVYKEILNLKQLF